ncbi:unnamed protein product, partial [Ectocarpus sp. 8 AP-2014]
FVNWPKGCHRVRRPQHSSKEHRDLPQLHASPKYLRHRFQQCGSTDPGTCTAPQRHGRQHSSGEPYHDPPDPVGRP